MLKGFRKEFCIRVGSWIGVYRIRVLGRDVNLEGVGILLSFGLGIGFELF